MTLAFPLEGEAAMLELERAHRHRAFAPPSVLTLSQWADKYRMLSPESSSEPGRWRTDRTPWLREIMDSCSDPRVERIVFMKPAQVGGTEIANNFVGYFMDQDPSPVLVLQPTLDIAQLWSKERLDPMLRDSPRLRGKVHDGNRREKDQSILRKVFPGGYLAIVGANSAAGLRARPVRAVLADEVDAYPQSAKGSAKKDAKMGSTGEGDPLSLAIKRTTTFWNRKILEISTPTVQGLSRIAADYEISSQGRWTVPCPLCGYEQVLVWRNLQWESGEPETAAYRCGEISPDGELVAGCGELIPEHYKSAMNQRGRFVHRFPERRMRGFWLNALCSEFDGSRWGKLADEWVKAQGDNESRKVFVNTVLAETWQDRGDALSDDVLAARRAEYAAEVPMGAGLLTMAVDVQGDRLEYLIRGWGKGRESWFIKHEQLWGDPAKQEVWNQLDLVRTRAYQHESGADLHIRWTFIDSGGHHTDAVYRYCKSRRSSNVYAIKGVGDPGRAPVGRASKGNKAKVALFPLGTIALKDAVFAALRNEAAGPGYMHFPKTVSDEYLRQLASERKITRYINGRPSHTYVLIGGRSNEALDLECYAYAAFLALGPAAESVGVLVDRLAPQTPVTVAPEPPTVQFPQRPAPRRGSWATGGGTWKLR